MKNKYYTGLIAFSAIIYFASCSKTNDTTIQNTAQTTPQTTVQIGVLDSRDSYNVTGDAKVNLYASMNDVNNNTPQYSQLTEKSKPVTISVNYLSQYYVVVTKGTETNYISGFIPIGIFQSQSDIQLSPIQNPAGTIGGVKYQDLNGDGIINASDKTNAPTIPITAGTTNSKTIIIY
jgi:hypothetical protein